MRSPPSDKRSGGDRNPPRPQWPGGGDGGQQESEREGGRGNPAELRRPQDIADLKEFLARSQRRHDGEEVKRFGAVLSYIDRNRAIETAKKLKTVGSCVNKWIRCYVTAGSEGLLTQACPGSPPKLDDAQLRELATVIEAAAGSPPEFAMPSTLLCWLWPNS